MSGKRLLDAAAFFKAVRGVAGQSRDLQGANLDLLRKTSSLAKAVKDQTDRVTLTLKAASVLNERLGGRVSQFSAGSRNPKDETGSNSSPSRKLQRKDPSLEEERVGLAQDHFYEPSPANSTSQPAPEKDLEISQEKTQSVPLPDGSVPPRGATSAEPNSDVYSHTPKSAPVKQPVQPSEEDLQPEMSGRSSIPDPANSEASESSSAQQQTGTPVNITIPSTQAVPKQADISEDMYSEIFQSPKVARLLRQDQAREPANEIKPKKAQDQNVNPFKEPSTPDSEIQNLRTVPNAGFKSDQQRSSEDMIAKSPQAETSDEDIQSLASGIAAETFNASVEIPSEVVNQTANETQAYEMRESRVPSSRFGRLWQYGGLATSMAFGAVGEGLRRATGSAATAGGSLMLSAGNMDRLVAKLSRMRGAALKLGQMMSFQDAKMLPAPIHEVLQRVQDSADYMPASQRNSVLASNLGDDWRSLFSSFDEKPIAAASIGQVHSAVLASSGESVAVKVQYPGVATSIDSDLNNLSLLLTASRLLPKGLYLDKTIANARTELAWECDYEREAAAATKFYDLLGDDIETFTVPKVISEASRKQVLTLQFMSGVGVTKPSLHARLSQEDKDRIGSQILRLCLREITEFKYMQTDPNWTNFLYNTKTRKLELLDFGASRAYPDEFIVPYIRLLRAASRGDREACRDLSIQLGYLTGHESKTMVNAHVESVLTLAEPFRKGVDMSEVYDFKDQTITDRVRGLIPVMLKERLAPPPEETYSLHRKLSGAFLLCARLGSKVKCREMFEAAMVKAGVQ
ncbi:hypothetical protein MMC25_000534 [Agyrium rufum]|nr:hypothetical protein [Agyrium rufum]